MNKSKFGQLKFLTTAIFLAVASSTIIAPSPLLAEGEQPDWGYGGADNSTHWDELSSEFESCEVGRDQSPIDISFDEEDFEKEDNLKEIKFDYQSSVGEVIDNGHTIQVDFQPGNSVNLNGETYELLQFHFHTPSEHRLENQSSAMELHLVHKNEAGKLAVVGVMMEPGNENNIISSVWNAIPTGNKAENASQVTIDLAELLPEDQTFVNYSGSLTTPPCSEQVNWNLMLEPIELSAEQIETFESFYPYNARPIQPLNGRLLKMHPRN